MAITHFRACAVLDKQDSLTACPDSCSKRGWFRRDGYVIRSVVRCKRKTGSCSFRTVLRNLHTRFLRLLIVQLFKLLDCGIYGYRVESIYRDSHDTLTSRTM